MNKAGSLLGGGPACFAIYHFMNVAIVAFS